MQHPFGARAANYRSAQVCWWLIATQNPENPLTLEDLLLRFNEGESGPRRELNHDELMHHLKLMTHAMGGTIES